MKIDPKSSKDYPNDTLSQYSISFNPPPLCNINSDYEVVGKDVVILGWPRTGSFYEKTLRRVLRPSGRRIILEKGSRMV